ncbi:ABC transporter substrate-binding protein [Streptomyces sp. NPDC091272]|uniref:ABC transporter substrate-binding protein n=1 Tax=Streptomyces sp. NPDC091272 TaxID=3365981 RepID=UPI003813DDA3
MIRKALPAALATALTAVLATGCGGGAEAGDSRTVTVTVGYQSKTINTVTAGTLLRSLGYFEEELAKRGARDGVTYKVRWQDYATGAPITAQMTAGKIDIGSMGDFPLLINAARGEQLDRPTRLVSVTGYNLRGGLNTVMAGPGSSLRTLEDLRGKRVSTSVGSAADGTLVRALQRAGLDPEKDIRKLNQQPAVGASALQSGSADALSQFVAWPGLLAFQGKGKALYDGAGLNLPTFHGVAARNAFAEERPALVEDFLRAQVRATTYLRGKPVVAAESVARATGLPAEVVYLYNGANGVATFDPVIRPALIDALKEDVPVLKSAKLVGDVDVDAFVDDRYLRRAYGAGYQKALGYRAPMARAELWLRDGTTTSFDSPRALLAAVAKAGDTVRAAYVPDASTGTPWFADKAVWVVDGDKLLPFVTAAAAGAHTAGKPYARIVPYSTALREAA